MAVGGVLSWLGWVGRVIDTLLMMMCVAKLCAPWLGYDRVVLMQDLLLAAVELIINLQMNPDTPDSRPWGLIFVPCPFQPVGCGMFPDLTTSSSGKRGDQSHTCHN